MRLPSVRSTSLDIPDKVRSYARRYAGEPSLLDGTSYRSIEGYMLQKTALADFKTVAIIDMPGSVLAANAFGLAKEGHSVATYSAGIRDPWRPDNDREGLPAEEDTDVTEREVPTVSFGAPSDPGLYPVVTARTDYSMDSALGNPPGFAPLTTRGGGPTTEGGGFWRSQLEAVTQLDGFDFYPFGEPDTRPAHWLSVLTGYGAGTSMLDVRISPEYVRTLAPGYYFQPRSNGGELAGQFLGGQGGTWPLASACRRTVDGVDMLAVAIPVTKFEATFWEYDVGLSGLLVLHFTVEEGALTLLRHHLFEVNALDPAMQVSPQFYPNHGDTYFMNNANMQSVVIGDDGNLVVYGAWLTSKWVELTPTGDGQEDGPGSVPLIHWYKATVGVLAPDGPTVAEFFRLRTSVYVSEDKDYDNWRSLDSDPSSPGVATPIDVVAMSSNGVTGAVAMCRQWNRSLFTYGGGTFPLAGRNYTDDPVAVYVFEPNVLASVATIYQSLYTIIDDGALGYQFWSTPAQWYGACVYDTRQIIFAGFDRSGSRAQTVRFLSVDVVTGALTSDPIPPISGGSGRFVITPKISTFQQKLFSDEDRTELARGFGATVAYVAADAVKTPVMFGYFGEAGWKPLPGMCGTTGSHYVGNGLFGQGARRFTYDGF